ncbi:hypothetical protein CDL15_Pgr018589 [Punica granatum]|uniref:Peroxisomal ATPase PEX6 n=1 Tax=Punica granatum TaxID=22663 RepID=A0A218X063_PUNGR|nr:hypothetical protein CDL15_Pgr018589 [Punica granatum]
MVERRKPLVLSSTKFLVSSVLSSSRPERADAGYELAGGDGPPRLQLPAGILRLPKDREDVPDPKLASFDGSALVGVSTSALKRLSITSGSLVYAKSVETNVERIVQVVVLDPPSNSREHLPKTQCVPLSQCCRELLVFPAHNLVQNESELLDHEVAYLSPPLAFNLGLHLSCFKTLLRHGEDTLASFFKAEIDDSIWEKISEIPGIDVELRPFLQTPRYASHLRASFVKIPECGTLESLRGKSTVEAEERQEIIDLALQHYFELDRYMARGDVFSVHIKWSCSSPVCIPCNRKSLIGDTIYFKVVAMEPSEEPVLRVNRTQTALVLGGSVPSAVPPDLLCDQPKRIAPLQGDTVKTLASILTPPLCPSVISTKFRVAVLLNGLEGCGKRTVVRHVASRLGLHVVEVSCHNLVASSERKVSTALAQAFDTAQRYSPTILLLRHFHAFRNMGSNEGLTSDQVGVASEVASVIREYTIQDDEEDGYPEDESNGDTNMNNIGNLIKHKILLVAAADSSEGLSPTIRRCFSHEISMGPLTEEQRIEMLMQSLQSISEILPDKSPGDFIKEIVGQTSGFLPRDIRALIADAGANLIPRGTSETDKVDRSHLTNIMKEHAVSTEVQVLEKEDLTKALERSKKRNLAALGTPKVPDVKWDDVGGLEDVKKSILDTVQLPLLHKDLFSSGLRKRSGVLLYGPPGTGKTLLAKAVATECSLNFLSVKGPELINMYIGESEKNVRDIFQKARSARPCVIFFDELDSLAPARGASGDSGGVMDRVVSQMLAEIDGLNDSSQDLFIIGASNRPDLIDPALLRPGRFDKLLYVGVNSDASYRERVLKALTRKFKLHEGVSLYSIAKKCPPNFTGADMYALCADAWFHAAKRKVLTSDTGSNDKDHQADSVVVEYEDFVEVVDDCKALPIQRQLMERSIV